jgi:hypothetical protein
MKHLILSALVLVVFGCSPTAPVWYEGSWYHRDSTETWHLIVSTSEIWCARHIGNSAVYSSGGLNDQRAYADSACVTPIDTAEYAIDINRVGDSLELTGQFIQPVYFTR